MHYTMKRTNQFQKFAVVVLTILMFSVSAAHSQTRLPVPVQEKLLNGLKVLMWPDAKADKVSIKIRIHAGSAFDPQGREGVMQMLADNIFPNQASRDFFTEDLGGGLEVVTTYDYIQINASSKPESFLTMLETLSTAVSNPTIDKETTAALRSALTARAAALDADPAYVADQAAAKRLFGTFPYGRPIIGTTDSLKRLEYADLVDAKNRFLTGDNATITITGNFDRPFGFKAVRRYFGSWLKSDKKVPSTFRQPDPPPTGVQIIESPKPEISAIRYAFRGTSRSDKDFAAAAVYTSVLESRLKARVPAAYSSSVFVRNEPHVLPGIISIGFAAGKSDIGAGNGKVEANDLVSKAMGDAVTDAEFQIALTNVNAAWMKQGADTFWLDVDTFKTAAADADRMAFFNVKLADVQNYADRLKTSPMAAILVNTPPPAK